jgi:hypothetical protein
MHFPHTQKVSNFSTPPPHRVALCDEIDSNTMSTPLNLPPRWSKMSHVADGEEITTPHLRCVC